MAAAQTFETASEFLATASRNNLAVAFTYSRSLIRFNQKIDEI